MIVIMKVIKNRPSLEKAVIMLGGLFPRAAPELSPEPVTVGAGHVTVTTVMTGTVIGEELAVAGTTVGATWHGLTSNLPPVAGTEADTAVDTG